jgi:hypothetical protein
MGRLLALLRKSGDGLIIVAVSSETIARDGNNGNDGDDGEGVFSSRARPNNDGGDCHPSDYVVDLLEKIDKGIGSVESSEVISQLSIEEKEPLKQFYDYRHQFYKKQHHHCFDDGQFAQGRPGLDDVNDLPGIDLPWSFIALSEAFDRLSQEGDAISMT